VPQIKILLTAPALTKRFFFKKTNVSRLLKDRNVVAKTGSLPRLGARFSKIDLLTHNHQWVIVLRNGTITLNLRKTKIFNNGTNSTRKETVTEAFLKGKRPRDATASGWTVQQKSNRCINEHQSAHHHAARWKHKPCPSHSDWNLLKI